MCTIIIPHGEGFEALMNMLIIEFSFIATFTQRFFGR